MSGGMKEAAETWREADVGHTLPHTPSAVLHMVRLCKLTTPESTRRKCGEYFTQKNLQRHRIC